MTADFVDASFYIALLDRKDRWHARSTVAKTKLHQSRLTTDLMAAEALASIGSRLGGKAALTAWQVIDDTAEVVFVERDLWEEALDLVLSRDGRISIADACAVVLMRDRGISRIASFDEGFDAFREIERLR